MNVAAQADAAVRRPYIGFDRLPIRGEWRQGKRPALRNYDPYTGELIIEIPQADRNDLDDAYTAAHARRMPGLPRCQARERTFSTTQHTF
jgi:aldehyde dehydrogenase (NAD+)